MKRIGLLLAAAILVGLPILAKADDDEYNYGDARRRLAQHEKEEFQRLKEHQKLEREACRADRSSERCRNLKQHQKRERGRVKAHHRRERDRLRDRWDGRRDARRPHDRRDQRSSLGRGNRGNVGGLSRGRRRGN